LCNQALVTYRKTSHIAEELTFHRREGFGEAEAKRRPIRKKKEGIVWITGGERFNDGGRTAGLGAPQRQALERKGEGE